MNVENASGRGPATEPVPLPSLPAPVHALYSAGAWLAATVARAASGPADRVRAVVRDWAEHPARLVWTLLISTALLSAVWPCIHYARGFWLHGMQWGFVVNRQNDYGEGPLFNQEVILYHLIFDHGQAAYRGLNMYQLGEQPPFSVGNYPPVFPLVAAVFMHFVGLTFHAGRLVSTLSILGASILVGLIVWQGTGQILPGILGFGILVTMRNGIWSWGPFNRVDSLALFWSMLTVFLVLRYAGTRKVWWAVPVALLTLYTRQSMVDGVFAAFCYLLVRDWRRALPVAAVTALGGLAIFLGLQIWTHGAFYLNVVVDNENAYSFNGALGAWRAFIAGEGRFAFPLAVAGAAAGLVGTGSVLWPVWLLGSVFIFATIGKTGAASNYYFTLEAATAACAALFIGRLRTFFRRAPFPLWPLEIVIPGMVFAYVHGGPPRWLPDRIPLAQQTMALVTGPSLASSPAASFSKTRVCKCWIQPADMTMVRYLQSVQGPVLGLDFPYGVVVQGGHLMEWQPFEFSVAYNDRTWDPAPFVAAILDRYYAIVVTKGNLGSGSIGGQGGFEISTALNDEYHFDRTVSGYSIFARNAPPTASPPVIAEPVPQPLLGALRRVLHLPPAPMPKFPLPVPGGLKVAPGGGNGAGRVPVPAGGPRVGGAVGGGGGGAARIAAMAAAATTAAGGNCQRGAAAKVDAGFTLVCLAYDEQVFGVAGKPAPAPCFDQGGICLDPADPAWPNNGAAGEARVASVPFWMPATGGGRTALKSAISFGPEAGGAVTVPVPAGKYAALYLIAAAGNGPGTADITFNYTSGSPDQATQQIDDWCVMGLGNAPAGTSAFLPADRWDTGGHPTGPSCGVLEYSVRIPSGTRTLSSIAFTDEAGNNGGFEPNVLAITLK